MAIHVFSPERRIQSHLLQACRLYMVFSYLSWINSKSDIKVRLDHFDIFCISGPWIPWPEITLVHSKETKAAKNSISQHSYPNRHTARVPVDSPCRIHRYRWSSSSNQWSTVINTPGNWQILHIYRFWHTILVSVRLKLSVFISFFQVLKGFFFVSLQNFPLVHRSLIFDGLSALRSLNCKVSEISLQSKTARAECEKIHRNDIAATFPVKWSHRKVPTWTFNTNERY